jgi:predicted dehydrogenase
MTVSTDPIRVALIGYGYVGKTFHAPLIKSVSGLQLTVVSSGQQEKVLDDFPGVQVLSNPEEAVSHPDVDLVVIASPNDSHVPLSIAALNAGKHLVVDKPFTITLAEAREIVALAEKKQRLLSVFHNRRWYTESLGAKAIIGSGCLGEVLHFESHFDRYRPVVRKRWREQEGPGAGLWYDLGPHLADEAMQLFGLPKKIQATLLNQRPSAEVDDWFHVQFDYGRLRVILHASNLVAGGVPHLTIHGTQGSWLKYSADVQETQLRSGMIPGDPGWGVDPRPGVFYNGADGTVTEVPLPQGDQRQYYSGIRDAIRNQVPNPVPPAQAIAVMAVLETAIESSAKGQWVSLPLTEQERAAYGFRK